MPGVGAVAHSGEEERIFERVRGLAGTGTDPLRILVPAGCEANLVTPAARFLAATGVSVELESVPVDEINPRLIARSLAASSTLDLALPATFGLPDLVEAGCLLDLDALAAQHEPEDFRNGWLYDTGDYFRGSLYGYQTDGDAYLMFYNRAFLEDEREAARYEARYGEVPAVPKTWEELDRLMAFFHRPDEGRYGGALFRNANYVVWEWWIRLHAKGLYPVGEDMSPRFEHPLAVQALEELVAASQSQYPGAKANGLTQNWEAYASGHSFCNIGWGGTQKYLNGAGSSVREHLLFGETPGGSVQGTPIRTPYFNWGWTYAVSATSRRPELAYLFALFACSPRASTEAVRARDGFFDPFRREHYDDPEIREVYSGPFLDVHQSSMEACIPDFYLQGAGEYWSILRRFLLQADGGQLEPARALEAAGHAWERISLRLGREKQSEQWGRLQERYPEALRAALE